MKKKTKKKIEWLQTFIGSETQYQQEGKNCHKRTSVDGRYSRQNGKEIQSEEIDKEKMEINTKNLTKIGFIASDKYWRKCRHMNNLE